MLLPAAEETVEPVFLASRSEMKPVDIPQPASVEKSWREY
jgi:hypothetical protein